MIAYLKGSVLKKQEKSLVLGANGVGYLVHVPRGLLENTSEGAALELFIHTHVREDELSLYGFATESGWQFFRLLLTVSGVGPKSALEILNAPEARVRQAIAKKNVAALTAIPGIGKKTAERILVDLEGKVKEALLEEESGMTAAPAREDLVRALVSLGYARHQVLDGLKKIPSEIATEEAVIKYFLQNI